MGGLSHVFNLLLLSLTTIEHNLFSTKAQDKFRIEKVLKRQGDESLVKWMGYPKSFNSWNDTKNNTKTNYREIVLKLLRKKIN